MEKITADYCKMQWILTNDKELGSCQLSKLIYWIGEKLELSPIKKLELLFNFRIFKKTDKSTTYSCGMYQSLMNDKEFGSVKIKNWNTEPRTK